MGKSQIQYGSQGGDVKELQTLLNKNGYSLSVDGIFGANTQKAVKDYQQKSGLAVDGIVGTNTWGSLLGGSSGGSTSTAVSKPTLDANPTTPKYDTTSWDSTEKGEAALGAYNDALNKVNSHGDFKYGNQAQLDAIMNSILNREKFTYDLNGDALYQQYKDKYIQQGKMAMGDAIGQAQAMTGGYGNSYAQSVGQQMYQKELQNLNDIVPELYQMALDRYNTEGQELYNKYGMLVDDRSFAYGQHQDEYNKLMDMLGIKRSDYYDGADMFYTEQSNKNSVADKEFNNAMEILNRNDSNAWKESEWDRDQTWRDEDLKLQEERWKVEDEQWQKQFDAVYGNNTSGGTSGSSSGSVRGSSGGSSGGVSNKSPNSTVQAVIKDGEGSYGNTNTKSSGITDSIRNKASGFSANADLANYLDGLVGSGTITEAEADSLYAEYKQADKAALNKRSWTLVDDGGVNWLWGVDNNAKVKDQYGNTYRLDKLVDALVAEGMSKSAAKTYVKNLQKQLGA